MLSQSRSSKSNLLAHQSNHYSVWESSHYNTQKIPDISVVKEARKAMQSLDPCSATGPDRLPARILKECACELAAAVQKLEMKILESGRWPDVWTVHWIVPLHKKKSVYLRENYRGIHLTAQLSKVLERLIQSILTPHLSNTTAFGPNQFAYTKQRGARDALALLALTWVCALTKGSKVAVYCSDVSGAFDRVCLEILVQNLRAKRVHPKIVAVIVSWLRQRTGYVVVGGEKSEAISLRNMVFQGTVLGPSLVFYEDARRAIEEWMYTEIVYADDLNAYRISPVETGNNAHLEQHGQVRRGTAQVGRSKSSLV